MKKIDRGYILPSAALTINRNQVKFYHKLDRPPREGDLAYGTIVRIGTHSSLENQQGRIHVIHNGTKAVFVFGNRYAPDYYEGFIPEKNLTDVDLLARSGMIGTVKVKSSATKDPTKVKLLGYVVDKDGEVINTKNQPLIEPRTQVKKFPRARLLLVCGTAMNSGKSQAAVALIWALKSQGHTVKACKVTGTAGLKDILNMNDAGAGAYADFCHFGHPSTYLLSEEELLSIFNRLDLKFANNPKNFWVVEFADGILQRETMMLLSHPEVQKRIHKLVFCAQDAFGAIGGLHILKDKYNLVPDAISGVLSSSPLHVRELQSQTDIPIYNSIDVDTERLVEIIMDKGKH